MVDFDFYQTEYLGDSIETETDFNRLITRAESQLEQYERIYVIVEPEEGARDNALCAIADAIYYFEVAESSQSAGSVKIGSVSSSSSGIDTSQAAKSREYMSAVRLYMDVYRGANG